MKMSFKIYLEKLPFNRNFMTEIYFFDLDQFFLVDGESFLNILLEFSSVYLLGLGRGRIFLFTTDNLSEKKFFSFSEIASIPLSSSKN